MVVLFDEIGFKENLYDISRQDLEVAVPIGLKRTLNVCFNHFSPF